MKRLETIPAKALAVAKTAHERALDSVLKQYQLFCTLPIRPVRMNILRQVEGREDLEQVIVPATSIHLKPNGFLEKNTLNRDALTYSIAGRRKPFPFGHIYQNSGHVCLGNIFVPSKISRFCPQQPLETLFLHNDRNLNHGKAHLKLSRQQIQQIREHLAQYQISLSVDADQSLVPDNDVLADDGIWVLSADVYQQAETLQQALSCMQYIYQIIFSVGK